VVQRTILGCLAKETNMPFYAYNAAGAAVTLLAEDVEDVVRNIDRKKTPLASTLPSRKIMSLPTTVNEDTLAAANADNAAKQGADAPVASDTTPTQRSVYTQIFTKTASAARTLREVKTYGIDDMLDYQSAKKMIECKRDLEQAYVSNNATVAPAGDVTAGKLAGLGNLITTNVNSTETTMEQTAGGGQDSFNALMQAAYEAGGEPGQVYAGGTQKTHISDDWGSNVTRMTQDALRSIEVVVDFYHTDFGQVAIDYHRALTVAQVFILQMDMLEQGYLTQWMTQELAITGDKRAKQILGEYCLIVKAEKALAQFDSLTG
jgi:hypothetical protein